MSEAITIIAKVVARKGKLELVKAELLKLTQATKEEEGCINYDLHQDLNDPHVFIFHENWETMELWQKHMESPSLETYKEATEGAIEKLILNKLRKI